MPDGDGSPFALATALSALTDERLIALLGEREVRRHGVTDFFTLAERLLDAASVSRALATLDRRTLLTLAVIDTQDGDGPVNADRIAARLAEVDHPASFQYPSTLESRLDRLAELALIVRTDAGSVALDVVHDVLADWPSHGLPDLAALAAPVPDFDDEDLLPSPDAVERGAIESAIVTPLRLIAVLDALAHDPARELARGGLGGPDLKRLGAAAGIEPARAAAVGQRLVTIAARTGLIGLVQGEWRPTQDAAAWVASPLPDRWARAASAWLAGVSDDVRHVLADPQRSVWGTHNLEYLDWMFPAAGDEVHDRQRDLLETGELLGLLHDGSPSEAGRAMLARGVDAARTVMQVALPAPVERVYVQQDLSIIAPGPLDPAIDARLRTVARVDALAVASTYRVSTASVEHALREGATADGILDLLASIATDALPQPLRYLVDDTAARFGRMRVAAIVEGSTAARATAVRSDDEVLLASATVDRRLAPLGLVLESPRLAVSRFGRDVVTLALADADYPAVAEDASGAIVDVERRRAGRGAAAPHPAVAATASDDSDEAPDALLAIVQTLRASQKDVGEVGWIERQLELAVRQKLRVTLAVRMPSGELEQYTVEPTGVANGRVRTRDRRADLERTFPLSRIESVGDPTAS